jgi:hypothetical protein
LLEFVSSEDVATVPVLSIHPQQRASATIATVALPPTLIDPSEQRTLREPDSYAPA